MTARSTTLERRALRAGSLRTLVAAFVLGTASVFGAAATPPSGPTLFREVSLVPMTSDRVEPRRDVLVENGRIARISPSGSKVPSNARVVEGRGRFLVPGLAEMHAHVPGPKDEQFAKDVLVLFAAHGITTIRGMLGHPWHLKLRESLARGEILGPRLYTAGPSFNDRSTPEVATAVRMVREQKAAGFDFLKLHPGLTVPVFDAIVATAREADIEFGGHVSEAVGLPRALEARQRAIDHLDGYMQELVRPGCLQGPVEAGLFGIGLTDCADESRIPALVARTRAAGTWMVPTQILLEQWTDAPTPEGLTARPAMRYMPKAVVAQWLEARERFLGAQQFAGPRARRFVELRRALLRELHRGGVPIALGSDAPQIFNVPGDSAHEELRVYAEIGLTPYEAMRTATARPAEFFRAEGRFGTIVEGAEADLVLLAANPLEDVRATRRIEGVMLRGRWLPRADLDVRLEELAARVAKGTSAGG